MKSAMKPMTLGVIIGNRGFFPDHLCVSGRATILKVLEEEGIKAIVMDDDRTPGGSIESLEDSHRTADLFRLHRDEIDGILITLPNFGDERAIANAIRWSELNVPVLLHAFPDETNRMTITDRRDSFCGKMSASNNLLQYGIPFTLTKLHTVNPESESFRSDLRDFMATCRVVRGLRRARIGAIGARPANFTTVRYSERLLERSGISIETLDLSEILGWIKRLDNNAPSVKDKLEAINAYIPTKGVPDESLLKIAKLGVVVDDWMADKQLDASAIQCWTAIEEFYGVTPCTVMSMMSDSLLPSACEVDVAGVIGMMALALASQKPSAIVDWNNNYGEDPNRAVVFHCSNLPKSIFSDRNTMIRPEDIPVMDFQEIIAGTLGKDSTFGTVVGRVKADPFTYLRVSTDDYSGKIKGYVGEGNVTEDPLWTFGGYGVVEIPNMQGLLQYICESGFEHHVAMNLSQTARPTKEALSKYMGWEIHQHN